jgi:hypothetical protein
MGISENIELLERQINRLKTEYEQYFLRLIKREPVLLRQGVEKLIAQCSNQQIQNTAVKFRFDTLTARYNSYKNYWTRILKAIEDGTYQKDLFKMNLAATGGIPTVSEATGTPQVTRVIDSDEKMKGLYENYIDARKRCNERVDGIAYEKLKAVLLQHTKEIKEQYKCKNVNYKVSVKDGKAKIVIVPVKEKKR